jgi:predicted nucleic acid-binding protein
MKALDTPVLLDVLRGVPAARQLVRSLTGEEVATTEINMFELGVLARSDRRPGFERRLAALERLRRKLTVLPVDGAAIAAAAKLPLAKGKVHSPLTQLLVATLESHGCAHWITVPEAVPEGGRLSLKVELYGQRRPKAR